MFVEAIENVYIDYSRNCVEGKIYEVKNISEDGNKYLIRDDEGFELYINKYHFKISSAIK